MNFLMKMLFCRCGLFLTALLVVRFQSAEAENDGHCVWYKVCSDKDAEFKKNCLYNGTPQPLLDKKAINTVISLCPDLVGDDENPVLCCDAEQVEILDKSVSTVLPYFSRCPSCSRNFLQMWCQSTCSPKQSLFMEVTDTVNETRGISVSGVHYLMKEEFATGIFSSCRNVLDPSTNQRAMNIMCGGLMDDECTVAEWLDFLGNPSKNPMAPFEIVFERYKQASVNISGKIMYPLNATVFSCAQATDNNTTPCSCQDCPTVCSEMIPYPSYEKKRCFIGQMDCLVFVALLTCCSVTVVIVCIAVVHHVLLEKEAVKSSSLNDKMPIGVSCGQQALLNADDVSSCAKIGAWLENKIEDKFHRWGVFCTRHPCLVFFSGITVSLICTSGLCYMQVTTDPVQIWSAPGSRARLEKDYFDSVFDPFYRIEQLIIVPRNQAQFVAADPLDNVEFHWGPVFRKEFLHEILQLQKQIENLTVQVENKPVTLKDICVQPLAPEKTECLIQSVVSYFQSNATNLDDEYYEEGFLLSNWLSHLRSCLRNPIQVMDTTMFKMSCLGEYGGPIFPYVALGGFEGSDYISSKAAIVTILVNNYDDPKANEKAQAWEKIFINFIKNYKSDNLSISFKAERSIEDEIERESRSDVSTILISYCVMFVYIVLALGQYDIRGYNFLHLLVQSKILLGLLGVMIVMLSVVSSLGFFAYVGIPTTLISIEVVPFLVLAVGVDNIFILVQAFQRGHGKGNEDVEEQIGRITAEVVPTMLLSSFSESFCFFLGALSSMPAVKVFSLYAALAIFFDFFLQITCFLALFTTDVRRQRSGRLEICCCVRVEPSDDVSDGFLHSIIRQYYSPCLLWKPMRVLMLVIFSAWFFSSVAVIDKIELGLDEKLSMPEDSYMLNYFKSMNQYLAVGPPVYFVLKGDFNYADVGMQNQICGSAGCNENSLYGQLFRAATYSNRSYIAAPVTSWLDDYFDWLRPLGSPPCCRLFSENHTFCPATFETAEPEVCHSCVSSYTSGRPAPDAFSTFLPLFLFDNPTVSCSKGGHAAYAKSVRLNGSRVVSSNFMTYHTVLRTSDDFIQALRNSRAIAANITKAINKNIHNSSNRIEVFPYSVYYVFYEQYLTLVWDATMQLIFSIASIFFVSALLLGLDFWSAFAICLTISMIVINLMGLMYWWKISFNAVSLVNLVMAVGISVEFCAHITRAFSTSIRLTRVERAKEALENVGYSVLSGITLTKFGGIVVLAFSHSQIFQVFYFRMYLGIVLFGAAHGLIFLPVFLSFAGPPLNKLKIHQKQCQDMFGVRKGGHHAIGNSSLASSSGSFGQDFVSSVNAHPFLQN
ncbi:Niemann-Pick C1 protein [Trichinella sp. T9]|nr:Niemann-Pick C1 protein [Trichinella sp. T9]